MFKIKKGKQIIAPKLNIVCKQWRFWMVYKKELFLLIKLSLDIPPGTFKTKKTDWIENRARIGFELPDATTILLQQTRTIAAIKTQYHKRLRTDLTLFTIEAQRKTKSRSHLINRSTKFVPAIFCKLKHRPKERSKIIFFILHFAFSDFSQSDFFQPKKKLINFSN